MIFHNYKAIFLHIPKTGGSSIEDFFDKQDRNYKNFYPDVVWGLKDRKYTQHCNYEEIKKHYNGENNIESYFKFTFVRNTWDRLLSAFSYLNPNPKKENFCKFIKYKCDKIINGKIEECDHYNTQLHYVLQNNKEFLNYVGRFENIQEDFKKICKELCIECRKLPISNKSLRGNYKDYYDEKTITLVGDVYKKEIEYFDYKY